MAKRRAQQQQAPGAPRPESGEADEEGPAYAAEKSEIERYLESIGVKIERRAPPAPRRQPAPPPKPEPVILRPAETQPYESPGAVVVEEEAPPQPPRPQPKPVLIPVRHEAPRPQPLPAWPAAPITPVPAEPAVAPVHAYIAPAAPRPALPVLGMRPDLSDLRRAVILTEILRRPNFERLPFERDPL